MIYGEHLNADEIAVTCPSCTVTATVEVVDENGRSHGWYCRRHAAHKRDELKRQDKQIAKIAKAIVRKGLLR